MILKTARQAWAVVFEGLKAQGWGVGGGSVGGNNADYRIIDGLEKGRIMAVIDDLPEQHYTWGMWTYPEHGEADVGAQAERELFLLEWLAKALDAEGLPDVRSDEEGENEARLLLTLLHDARERERNGRELYSKAAIAAAIGVDRRCLGSRYKWGQRYAVAQRAIDGLIAGALGPVAVVVDGMNARAA
ncbi:MAG: hypothetical protein AB9Q22_10120 [Candidatus Reddybacter sp.]